MADDTAMIDTPAAASARDEAPADLGDAGKQAIDRMKAERDEARKTAKQYESAAKRLEQIEAEKAKADQTAAEREAAAEQRAAAAELTALRLSVAFDKGLTPAQAKRLVGASREELEADADDILENFPVKTDGRPRGDVDQGVRQTAPPTDPRSRDLAQIEADLAVASRRKK